MPKNTFPSSSEIKHEEEKDVLLSGLLGELHDFGSVLAECDERKIRGLIANVDAHGGGSI